MFTSKPSQARRTIASRWLMLLMAVCFTAYLLADGHDSAGSNAIARGNQAYPSSVDPWEVILYEHPNFAGAFISCKMEPGMRHKLVERLPPEFEDKVSSIQVGSKVSVAVFVHRHWASDHGRAYFADAVFNASTAQVGSDSFLGSDSFPVNDKISSLIVYPNVLEHPIGVWVGDEYLDLHITFTMKNGKFFPLPEREQERESTYSSLGHVDLEKNANWVALYHKNVEVTLYEGRGFQGAALALPGAGFWEGPPFADGHKQPLFFTNLGEYGWSDRAASLKVRWIGPLLGLGPKGLSFPPHSVREKVKAPPAPPTQSLPSVREKVKAPPAPVAKLEETLKGADLSGQWSSNIGAMYEITQSGNKFTWSAPSINQQGTGTVSGKAVIASIGTVSIKGTITEVDATGQPTRIEWENGVVLFRAKGQTVPQGAGVNIAGQWSSNIGAIYEITQNGANFTWSAPSINQKGTGTVQGKTIVAYLDSGPAPFKGKISVVDANGRATRIEWENGVALFRQ